jgi:hypothetical protein
VGELEALKAVTSLSLLADGVKDSVHELSTLSVVTLGPVVACAGLAEDEVVWTEQLTEWARADGVHGAWLQVHEDGTWNIAASSGLIVVNVDAFNLKFGISAEFAAWVNTVLV